jgi:hypothetical protein
LRVAKSEATIVNSEAQITQSELLASKKDVSDAGVAALKAEKRIEREQENLGSWKEKVLTLRKSHEKVRKALEVSQNENFMLRRKITPLVQEVPVTTLTNAASVGKIHMVGMEERVKSIEAMAKDFALGYVHEVFDVLYCAIERSSALPEVDVKFTAKFLVDECYFLLYSQVRKAKVGFMPYKFRFENKMY